MQVDSYETPRGMKRWVCSCRASNPYTKTKCGVCKKLRENKQRSREKRVDNMGKTPSTFESDKFKNILRV